MKIFFAGTPEIAVESLKKIAENFEVTGVLTNPDKPAGRKSILTPPPVKEAAVSLGLKVFQPEVIDDSVISEIKKTLPDILVTFAYGKIFKSNFLSVFPKEALNIHPSLLPLHRGPSPLTAAILAGDRATGITIQKMALKMDSGDIISSIEFSLNGNETTGSLGNYVSNLASDLIVKTLKNIESGNYSPVPQDNNIATYCKLVKKEDGCINWNESASVIERKYRAYNPWPGIFTHWDGKIIVITECSLLPEDYKADSGAENHLPGTVSCVDKKEGIIIKTGEDFLAVKKLKPQARNEMDFKSFLNGAKDFVGAVLS